jgi:hypothetical protein
VYWARHWHTIMRALQSPLCNLQEGFGSACCKCSRFCICSCQLRQLKQQEPGGWLCRCSCVVPVQRVASPRGATVALLETLKGSLACRGAVSSGYQATAHFSRGLWSLMALKPSQRQLSDGDGQHGGPGSHAPLDTTSDDDDFAPLGDDAWLSHAPLHVPDNKIIKRYRIIPSTIWCRG